MEKRLKNTNDLLSAFINGDDSAFSQLYDTHIDMLYNYGSRITANQELLKDCIHDVFVKLYLKRSDLVRVDNLRSYMVISLRNRVFDEIRKKRHYSTSSIDDYALPIEGESVEDNYLLSEQRAINNQRVNSMMSKLSPRQREALELYYIQGRDYDAICSILTVTYQLARILMIR